MRPSAKAQPLRLILSLVVVLLGATSAAACDDSNPVAALEERSDGSLVVHDPGCHADHLVVDVWIDARRADDPAVETVWSITSPPGSPETDFEIGNPPPEFITNVPLTVDLRDYSAIRLGMTHRSPDGKDYRRTGFWSEPDLKPGLVLVD